LLMAAVPMETGTIHMARANLTFGYGAEDDEAKILKACHRDHVADEQQR
jgi:hypothetical protein